MSIKKCKNLTKAQKKKFKTIAVLSVSAFVVILCAIIICIKLTSENTTISIDGDAGKIYTSLDGNWNAPDYVSYEPLTPNSYSRPQTKLEYVDCLVVHYVANPGTTAEQNRSYFEGLSESEGTYASSHFIIGLEGEVIQIIPLDEISYASNERNYDSVSIECCHPDEDGKFNDETYDSLIKLLSDLCEYYGLDPQTQIIRHYDITGKMCPLYYVNNEDEWQQLKDDVNTDMFTSENSVDETEQ